MTLTLARLVPAESTAGAVPVSVPGRGDTLPASIVPSSVVDAHEQARNIVAAAYPSSRVRWRGIFGAYAAGASRHPEPATANGNAKVDLWKTYTSVLKRARYVDLTHTITPNMPVWKGFGPATLLPRKTAAKCPPGVQPPPTV